ncbi:SDR family NAD(P)-dependent oxidoreductase [Crossiella sp. NPDC003009]
MTEYRTALVTGASSGIGQAYARVLAARGCDLVIVARRAERLELLATELREQYQVTVETMPADLTDDGDLRQIEKRLADTNRPVDLLINNAGIPGGDTVLGEGAPAGEEDVVATNAVAPLRLINAALPGMIERKGGGIVNVASLAGLLPGFPPSVTYGASKAFLLSFSEGLAVRARPLGVRITAVCPGYVHTEMTEGVDDVPEFFWTPSEKIVADSLRGLRRNRPLVVPSKRYGALAAMIRIMPRGLARLLSAHAA